MFEKLYMRLNPATTRVRVRRHNSQVETAFLQHFKFNTKVVGDAILSNKQ